MCVCMYGKLRYFNVLVETSGGWGVICKGFACEGQG